MGKSSKSSNNESFKKIFILILILFLPIGGFLLGKQYAKNNSATGEINDSTWKSYTHKKYDHISFSGFTLHYPSSWIVTTNDNTIEGLTLKLHKDNSYIEIRQGAFGISGCQFPGEEKNGPYNRFGEYKTIRNFSEFEWRRAESLIEKYEDEKDFTIYGICSGGGNEFSGATEVGVIRYYIHKDDLDIINQFDEILNKIEILE